MAKRKRRRRKPMTIAEARTRCASFDYFPGLHRKCIKMVMGVAKRKRRRTRSKRRR